MSDRSDTVREAVIFDMDGTLCDVSSIRHLVASRPRNFDAFHAGSIDCPPNPEVLAGATTAKADGFAILIVTARTLRWRYHTIVWLAENNVQYDELYMRDDNDGRRDYLVKAEILERIHRDGYEPVMAWDDNPAVIELWRRNNIPVTVVPGWDTQQHEVDADTLDGV